MPASSRRSAPAADAVSGQPADKVQLIPAALREIALTGRVAANVETGHLTGDQAKQIYDQISAIHSQILAALQANGGTISDADAQAIQESQNQLSQTIYSQAHDGAAPPDNPYLPRAAARQAVEAGRIALNEKAGNLSSDQAKQLSSQLAAIHKQIVADEQANGGSLSPADAQAINQLQRQLSQQIYQAAHGGATSD